MSLENIFQDLEKSSEEVVFFFRDTALPGGHRFFNLISELVYFPLLVNQFALQFTKWAVTALEM